MKYSKHLCNFLIICCSKIHLLCLQNPSNILLCSPSSFFFPLQHNLFATVSQWCEKKGPSSLVQRDCTDTVLTKRTIYPSPNFTTVSSHGGGFYIVFTRQLSSIVSVAGRKEHREILSPPPLPLQDHPLRHVVDRGPPRS